MADVASPAGGRGRAAGAGEGGNASNPFAVAAGTASGRKSGATSYVLCHQPKSFDWRLRGGKPHPMRKLGDKPFAEVLLVLNQIVQLA